MINSRKLDQKSSVPSIMKQWMYCLRTPRILFGLEISLSSIVKHQQIWKL